MTEQTTMPDWVLIEGAKRSGPNLGAVNPRAVYSNPERYSYGSAFRALCDMILKHEQPPVDRKVLCAREAQRAWYDDEVEDTYAACVRAIDLWEQGFGQ